MGGKSDDITVVVGEVIGKYDPTIFRDQFIEKLFRKKRLVSKAVDKFKGLIAKKKEK